MKQLLPSSAKPQLDGLVLFSVNPATHKMEDELNFWQNGRRPQYFGKMEDDLNCKINGRRPQFKENRKRPQFEGKGKTTSI